MHNAWQKRVHLLLVLLSQMFLSLILEARLRLLYQAVVVYCKVVVKEVNEIWFLVYFGLQC